MSRVRQESSAFPFQKPIPQDQIIRLVKPQGPYFGQIQITIANSYATQIPVHCSEYREAISNRCGSCTLSRCVFRKIDYVLRRQRRPAHICPVPDLESAFFGHMSDSQTLSFQDNSLVVAQLLLLTSEDHGRHIVSRTQGQQSPYFFFKRHKTAVCALISKDLCSFAFCSFSLFFSPVILFRGFSFLNFF